MNISKNNKVSIVKILISIIIFLLSIKFENVSNYRLFIFLAIFIAYLTVGIIRNIYTRFKYLYVFSFLIDILLIFYLEHNSKYLINYFLHLFYIIILVEISLSLELKYRITMSVLTLLISLIKYCILIYYKNNLGNISEMLFFTLISILATVIINFARYYKEEKEKKDELYMSLLEAHRDLRKYADVVEQYSKIEERTRIARDIHDTLGHEMTALIMQLEMSSHLMDKDIQNAKNYLNDAKTSARESLIEVRKIIETLKINNNNLNIFESIKEMSNSFSNKTGVNIDIKIDGDIVKTNPTIEAALYRTIQESITNAVRHGKAKNIFIFIICKFDVINFEICNDGFNIDKIKEGNGIKGMKERIYSLNGEINIESRESFKVSGFIPLDRGDINDKSIDS
ncbi:signal transduction histidine kinase [Gottschalkia purinilytica]|uniref:histidine kinase n=1 Tax=Gottschalkia purinilytica TaxID=1503 RepID=A0A0L0W9T9_GOTPU|nr:sensor histidine kinase [Gottschalkia purinilytica]KNF08211.1 signal transduction histidine kinase [Gottschalkia purinilytica]